MSHFDVIVVGAGLAGLSCGVELTKRGKTFKILEASDEIGGRVRTDVVDGFRLDHGFQVFLTAYPEAKQVLDFNALGFKKFKSGAIIRYRGGFCRVSDIVRHPGDIPGNLFSQAASLADKLKIASLRNELNKLSIAEIADSENTTTRQRLEQFGFSQKIIGSFFRPFFGGVFLEPQLATSRRMFDFVFKMFASGDVVIPGLGMGEISKQLASRIQDGAFELSCPVVSYSDKTVKAADGRVFHGNAVVIATDQSAMAELKHQSPPTSCGVTCVYFAAEKSPVNEPILVLNGDEKTGPINNLCVPSDVSEHYAPRGKSLVSVTVLGADQPDSLTGIIVEQARSWYGSQVDQWEHLKTYNIPRALPRQNVDDMQAIDKPMIDSDVFYCGDYLSFASIEGAIKTGRIVAEAVEQLV